MNKALHVIIGVAIATALALWTVSKFAKAQDFLQGLLSYLPD